MNDLIYLTIVFYYIFPRYSLNPLNFAPPASGTIFLSCLWSSCLCSHKHRLCSSRPKSSPPVWLSNPIQQDHPVTSTRVIVPELASARLIALNLPQPTILFSSVPSSLIMSASISTPPPSLHPISVPFHSQLEIPTFCCQMECR